MECVACIDVEGWTWVAWFWRGKFSDLVVLTSVCSGSYCELLASNHRGIFVISGQFGQWFYSWKAHSNPQAIPCIFFQTMGQQEKPRFVFAFG
jgi:hypothetical protein